MVFAKIQPANLDLGTLMLVPSAVDSDKMSRGATGAFYGPSGVFLSAMYA